ncbi:hypothetical protein [Bacillus sp. EB600]|uniref:hypothetical protein n=1 Tax=Bacillus sp. EB600 TaxID=2806345 RepID=UPI00210B8310|nr:hypothetical protein [Bacillus sp. EB600]MCQ6281619.1 hypothetical protein [Bacillus sp. EB600]
MNLESLQSIEYESALLVRLTTAYSPKLGELDHDFYSETLQNWSTLELKQLEANLIRLNKDFKKRKNEKQEM